MVVWSTVAEQYRIACGELEARQPAIMKKFFFKKMCNSMKKPTGKSGDDMTAKCQALSRSLVQLEEGDIFGDSDEEEPYFRAQPEYDPDSSDEEEEEIRTPSAATDSSSKQGLSMLTGSSDSLGKAALDTKSKNSKPNPTTRFNVGKGIYIVFYYNFLC
jgi:hypothetical protein